MKLISIVVPCYNEEENVYLFYSECKKIFSNKRIKIEIIYVNDGSKDNTLTKLKKLNPEENIDIKIVSFSRNFGKEAAMYAGLQKAIGDYIVIIDADLQQNPSLIMHMYDVLEANETYDCVCYYQEKRIENKIITCLKEKFYSIISKLSGINFVNAASDFRMFKKNVIKTILNMEEKNRFSKGIFSWIGYETYYIPYVPQKRKYGKSNFNLSKSIKYALNGIISFSTLPLRLATYIGMLFSLISFIYLVVVVIQKCFFSINIPVYATLIYCMLLIGGLILFCLGIIGEYIAKIYIEVKKRPIFIEKEYIYKRKEDNRHEKK